MRGLARTLVPSLRPAVLPAALGLLCVAWTPGVWAQAAGSTPPPTAPALPGEHYKIAVFQFTDQTYQENLAPLEPGFRDIIAQTMGAHPSVTIVDPLEVERAIRRHGWSPRRPIPYRVASQIAKELGAERSVCGTMTQVGTEVRVEAQMAFLDDPTTFQWPVTTTIREWQQAVPVGVDIALQLLTMLPVDPSQAKVEFLVGQRVTLRIASTAASVSLKLGASEPGAATLRARGFRITKGKTIGSVAWDADASALSIAVAADTTEHDWVVEVDAVVTCRPPSLRLALVATPGAGTELTVLNANVPSEGRVVKDYKMGEDTPSAEVLVQADLLNKDGPVFLAAKSFSLGEGSLPLHEKAPPTPPGGPSPPPATQGTPTPPASPGGKPT